MAQDEDTRTPEQMEEFAVSCERCAAETRAQAEALMTQADEWQRLAKESRTAAAVRRGEVPSAKKAASKSSAKRSAR